MEKEPYHYSVLLKESIDALNIRPGDLLNTTLLETK